MFYIKENIQKYSGEILIHVILYKDSQKYALKTGKTLKKKISHMRDWEACIYIQ